MFLVFPLTAYSLGRLGLCSGEFVVVNKHLLHDLTDMGLWTPTLKNKLINENGSIVNVAEIPDDLKAIYRYSSHFFCVLTHFYV